MQHTEPRSAWQGQIALDGLTASLTLENGVLSLAAQGPGGMGFQLEQLCHIALSGQTVSWAQLVGSRQETSPDGTLTLTLELEDGTGSLRALQHLALYPQRPFLRTWGQVENTGSQPLLLDGCRLFTLRPAAPPPLALFTVEQFSAKYSRDHFRPVEARLVEGRAPHQLRMGSLPSIYWQPTSCAWFALLADQPGWFDDSPQPGPGLVCGVEFNGKSRVTAGAADGAARLAGEVEDLSHRLEPGAVFQVPAVFFGQFTGDWDEAGYATQRFAEAFVHPPRPDGRYPWVQYNSWAYGQDICEAQQLEAIDRCAELGLELAVLDLGWARAIGDWRPDPVKFPRGLKPLAERARSYGMRFGVHVALAQCSLDAPAAKEHLDWLVHPQVDYFGAAPLCLGHQPCREWLLEALSRLVEEEGIDYIVQDGEDMVKHCQQTGHTHAPGDSNYANSHYGLDLVIQELRERFPHLVIENCEDGGCMMTYRMARLYHTSITVDNIDSYSTRQGVYGASYPFSPRYSVRYMQDAPTRYTLYSSLFGGPLIFMHQVTQWDDAQREETRRAVALYKQLRPLIRDGKVIHLLRPSHNIPGGGWGWDAIQAVSASRNQAVVMAYRAQGDTAEKTLYPRGLAPEGLYRVRLGEQELPRRYTGAQLEQEGLPLTLPPLGAEILLLDRES